MPKFRNDRFFLWKFVFLALGVVAIATTTLDTVEANDRSGYRLAGTVKIGGVGGWDYLTADPTTHRVFLSHATHTVVVDQNGRIVGDIPGTSGVHGIALAPEFNRGFTSNGQANSVTIFDLTTLKTIDEVKVTGQNPDSILFDTASKQVFTFNGRSGDSTVIDAKGGTVVGTIPLGGKPETAQSDGRGHIYVNLEDKSEIAVLDVVARRVTDRWSIAPCDSPSGLAFDVAHKRLFAGCENKLMTIVDSDNGKVVQTLPIGAGVDANAFDPGTGLAFASCGDGTISVVHEDSPDKFSAAGVIPTRKGARTMTVDTSNHRLYTVTAEFGPTPDATANNPRPRPSIVPESFTLLIYKR